MSLVIVYSGNRSLKLYQYFYSIRPGQLEENNASFPNLLVFIFLPIFIQVFLLKSVHPYSLLMGH
jgi:hypothetical protein